MGHASAPMATSYGRRQLNVVVPPKAAMTTLDEPAFSWILAFGR